MFAGPGVAGGRRACLPGAVLLSSFGRRTITRGGGARSPLGLSSCAVRRLTMARLVDALAQMKEAALSLGSCLADAPTKDLVATKPAQRTNGRAVTKRCSEPPGAAASCQRS